MRICFLNARPLRIPFRYGFSHASANRAVSESVLVVVETENGVRGYGESCPRPYVTQERLDSTVKKIKEISHYIFQQKWSASLLVEWADTHQQFINRYPAAWCAIELALTDALCKENNLSVEELLGFRQLIPQFQYSAVLGTGSDKAFLATLGQYQKLGFMDFKIKLSGDIGLDQVRIKTIKEKLPTARVRVDANNYFSTPAIALNYFETLHEHLFAIEEPLRARDFKQLKKFSTGVNCKIILDECLLRSDDFRHFERFEDQWIPNLRISKLGGLIRSYEMLGNAQKMGLPVVIGSHVGETSLLTRAAMSLASQAPDLVVAMEGGFSDYLLTEDIISKPLRFGKNGLLVTHENIGDSFGLGNYTGAHP
ncbi:MAG: hypothetical protein OEZ43_03835 [Gammaproteobacteria bacterium]|nr:hypothetical protein [Gammaproteobacteria bacterium]